MQKQQGDCAFSAACVVPGPRVRLQGTNRVFCGVHARQLLLPLAEAGVSEFARIEYRRSTRRNWALDYDAGG